MESKWPKGEMKEFALDLAEILTANGMPAVLRRGYAEYAWLLVDPITFIQRCRLEFLDSGDVACTARGFRVVDSPERISVIADMILERPLPGRRISDMTQYGFRVLECRSRRHMGSES